ncbi:hypothetical protein SEA_SCHIMMELS22_7 [Microbacterium phage Schimmels22]|nr:hypothetical protein SEA_SCHIMMELS22_7 [Microbacterium phage Schimmels22]
MTDFMDRIVEHRPRVEITLPSGRTVQVGVATPQTSKEEGPYNG